MGNSSFRFKQFSVNQELAAMKVGTDGVLLGAWATHFAPRRILDIGTGTGLIALMLAQRFTNAHIDAIEIDENAAKQAIFNVENSPWNDRISVIYADYLEFSKSKKTEYDLIVTNPPFFSNSLKNNTQQRTLARHDESLPLTKMLAQVAKNLAPNGLFSIVLPFDKREFLLQIAENQFLFPIRLVEIYPSPQKSPHRILAEFSTMKQPIQHFSLTIEINGRHQYSDEYRELTRDFYLAF